jgi:cytochrome c
MKKPLFSFLFLALTVLSQSAVNASEALGQKNNCFACHAMDKKILGPAFIDVAKRDNGKAGAEQALALTIRKGSSGKWGAIPMPGNEQLSEADAATLAKWILSLK